MTPRSGRLLRRKRKLEMDDAAHPRKRRRLGDTAADKMEIDDAQKGSDASLFVDAQSFTDKDNSIAISKFDSSDEAVYEIRCGSFADPAMREFHQRLQFFVLLVYLYYVAYIGLQIEDSDLSFLLVH